MKLLEQAFLFEVLLNQYSYETLNLISIVNSAINGKIHTSVFSSEQLLMELREIKLNLPGGIIFPLEIKAESLTQLIQISVLAIFHKEHYLVFSLGIPLISVEEYTIYHPISLPIQYDNNTIALIPPEVDYLALSNDNEKFFLLETNRWESCDKLKSFTLCKGDQPIHYQAGSNLCDLSRISELQSLLKDCKVRLVTLNAPVWHWLTKTNSWLYFTQPNLCTIKCSDPPQTFKVEISGVGRLTTSPSCKIHTGNSILVANDGPRNQIRGEAPSALAVIKSENADDAVLAASSRTLLRKAVETPAISGGERPRDGYRFSRYLTELNGVCMCTTISFPGSSKRQTISSAILPSDINE
ncbi:hypothetical protein QTP88_026968 [Uroleucon formosanum]